MRAGRPPRPAEPRAPRADPGQRPPRAQPEAPQRAAVGSARTVQARLALQRPRPLLVRCYAALFSDAGWLGAPARRRALRLAVRSLPAAVTVALGAGLSLRAFDAAVIGWPQAALIGAALAVMGWRGYRRLAAPGAEKDASYREQLELGALLLAVAYAAAQAAAPEAGESPLQPAVLLVVGLLGAFLSPWVVAALALEVTALEAVSWTARGARPAELPEAVLHVGFVAAFAALYSALLSAQVAAGRRQRRAALARRVEELEEAARQFRLVRAAGDGPEDPAERERRWTEGAVAEIQAAVGGALEVAEAALRAHTCALYWLSDDEKELSLRDCRSRSESVARGPLPAGEGILGGAVRRKAAVRLHGELKAVNHYLDGTQPIALLAVPLIDRRGGHVRGVLVVDRLEGDAFGPEDEALLGTLGAQVLRAVDAERLMRDVRETREQADRFYQAIERLNRAKKLSEVIGELIGVARSMVPADLAAVVLVGEDDPTRARVVRVEAVEEVKGAAKVEGLEFPTGEGLVGSAIARDATLPIADVDPARTPLFGATSLKGLGALRVIPLKAGATALGALVLGARQRGAFAREVVLQLEVVAMQAGQSIERARLFDRTERLATTDGLTSLLNHRTFQERLDAQLAQAQRYGKRLSLLICDVDHFKSVNDTYGHPVGDQVLRGVARTLQKEARTTDLVARYGGEEFAIVMPETDTAGAMVIAERIRERVGGAVFETPQGPLKVTISLGVATFPEDGKAKAELVARSDGCLYHAKRHGRNQSVAACTLRTPPPRRAAG